MTRIFISHSHADEMIAHKLFDFLICALKLEDEDILCTSDPNSGLSFNSNSISDQLKANLKSARALLALITRDSLRSPWIPFEIGSFWPTEKIIVLILGPGLKPEKLPGPLRGWRSICIDNSKAFEQLNQVINQLEKELEIRQSVNRSRRDRYLREFITRFKAWQSTLPATDVSQQQENEDLKARIQELEQELSAARSQVEQLKYKEQSQFKKYFPKIRMVLSVVVIITVFIGIGIFFAGTGNKVVNPEICSKLQDYKSQLKKIHDEKGTYSSDDNKKIRNIANLTANLVRENFSESSDQIKLSFDSGGVSHVRDITLFEIDNILNKNCIKNISGFL